MIKTKGRRGVGDLKKYIKLGQRFPLRVTGIYVRSGGFLQKKSGRVLLSCVVQPVACQDTRLVLLWSVGVGNFVGDFVGDFVGVGDGVGGRVGDGVGDGDRVCRLG